MDNGFASTRFTFVSKAESEDAFSVTAFTGREGVNELYAFTIDLVSSKKDVRAGNVLQNPATFSIRCRGLQGGDLPFHGMVLSFEEDREANGLYFYRATLVPAAHRLRLSGNNRVWVDKTVVEVLEDVLQNAGLDKHGYAFKLQADYPERELTTQYNERDYDFLRRRLARNGMYFYFEQTDAGERMIITDTKLSHVDMPQGSKLTYAPTSGQEEGRAQQVVRAFAMRRTLTPTKVTLKDFNYRKPNLDLTATEQAVGYGSGETFHYGDHHRTPSRGATMAKLRAEGFKAASEQAHGESFVPFLRPGYTFTLGKHYNNALNQQYLTLSVKHRGQQPVPGVSGLEAEAKGGPFYKNTFTALPAKTQYRPGGTGWDAPGRNAAGIMHARVDAAGSGQYAELDDQGRYRIKLLFDESGLRDGKASSPVRKMEPYAGAGFGMHAPLHKGAETAVAFVDGNPDRPVIVGAAPNPNDKSQIDNESQTRCRLTTAAGNKMHFQDKEGEQRMLFQAKGGDFLRIGAHNDPTAEEVWESFVNFCKEFVSEDGIALYAPDNHWIKITAQAKLKAVLGEWLRIVLGDITEIRTIKIELNLALRLALLLAWKKEFEVGGKILNLFCTQVHDKKVALEGSHEKVTMEDVTVSVNKTKTAVQDTKSAMEKLTVGQSKVDTAAEAAEATENEIETTGTKTHAAGEKMELAQVRMATAGEECILVGERTELANEKINTQGKRTAMFGQRSELFQEKATVVGERVDTLAEDVKCFIFMDWS